jgi:hypothetical protein
MMRPIVVVVVVVVVIAVTIVGRRAHRPSFKQDVAAAVHPPRSMRGSEDGNDGVPPNLDASTDKDVGNGGAEASIWKVLGCTTM